MANRNAPLRQPRQGATNAEIPGSVHPRAANAKTEDEEAQLELPKVVVDDEPVTAVEEPKAEPKVTDDDLDSLRQQIAEAKARDEASRRRIAEQERQLEETNRKLQGEQSQTIEATKREIENGLAAAQSALDQAEAKLADAHNKADAAGIAKATREMMAAQQKLSGYEFHKQQLETYQRQQTGRTITQAQSTTRQSTNTVDVDGNTYDLSAYSARERQWIKSNPKFLTDQKFQLRASAAAQLALAEGISDRDSDEYIEFINAQVNGANNNGQEKTVAQRPVSAAAPGSRSMPSRAVNGRGANGEIKLSAQPAEGTDLSEVEAALMAFPKLPKAEALAKYGQYREELRAEGKLR